MADEELYDKAFRQIDQAPPEAYENLGPGRPPGSPGGNRKRWKNHESTAQISIRIPAAILEWLDIEADNRDLSRSEYINGLLRQVYDAGK
jgi:hypothetical protein